MDKLKKKLLPNMLKHNSKIVTSTTVLNRNLQIKLLRIINKYNKMIIKKEFYFSSYFF